jgi:hypothetical protein
MDRMGNYHLSKSEKKNRNIVFIYNSFLHFKETKTDIAHILYIFTIYWCAIIVFVKEKSKRINKWTRKQEERKKDTVLKYN